ncbi:MAG: hypothetical protein IJI84_06140 [Clostridia bacterium]|nr:hypothetical protein [Clostridia bacterium]
MDSYVTRLQDIELIAGDSKIVLEFQVFYEDGEPLDLQDDSAKWYLSPIGMKHSPILVRIALFFGTAMLKQDIYITDLQLA